MSDVPGATTMRVDRTFAFIDLSGFTRYTETEGDGAATEVLRTFREVVRDAASSRGVRIAKWLGDGAMLVGVESRPVVEAVVDIERRVREADGALPLRAGISGGPVILFEGDDYIGHAVNMAARLCDEAAPSGVFVTEESIDADLEDVTAEPAGARSLRGVEGPVPLIRVHPRP